jgi:pilus assembly protein CpaB
MFFRRLRIASGGMLLFAALAVGLVTAVITMNWLNTQQAAEDETTEAPATALVTVLAARDTVPAGTTLSAPLLKEIEVPQDSTLLGGFTNTNRLVGRVTLYPLVANEQIVESKLVGSDSPRGTGLAFSVPDGMRAVSVPFSEVMGAGGLVVAGDRVDVLVATQFERLFGPDEDIPADEDGGRPIVVTVLQDVLVLSVGQAYAPATDAALDPATQRRDNALEQPDARSVTLAVTPTQAQQVFFATQQGTLGLAMRSFGDDNVSVLSPEFKLEPEIGFDADALAAR